MNCGVLVLVLVLNVSPSDLHANIDNFIFVNSTLSLRLACVGVDFVRVYAVRRSGPSYNKLVVRVLYVCK